MVLAAKRRKPRRLFTSSLVAFGLLSLTACEPPNEHPEPIGGPYLEKLSGAWSPRDPNQPCPTQKVPLLRGSFVYDMSPFCSVAVVPL